MPDQTRVHAKPDGALYPWAESLAGTWHARPRDDHWNQHDIAAGDVRTLCGRTVTTVQVSEFDPRDGLGPRPNVCKVCASSRREVIPDRSTE